MKDKFTSVLRNAALLLIVGMLALSADPVYAEKKQTSGKEETDLSGSSGVKMNMEDGEYSIQVDLEGGSGKAGVVSPTVLIVRDGRAFTRLQWSSSNYDYMIVDGEKYLPVNEEGMNSVFEIPVSAMDEPVEVIADTTAMGTPHEVEYTLLFYADSIGSKGQLPQEAAKRVVGVALVIIVGGGILNYFVNKRNRC
ncbi:hypothetical protein [Blautia sp.]|jgi:hypothetical protein|uniref:hypothetical protein n=1 Tax=Blautia sp. TaxID=1955243 RepID=UPI003D90FDF6